MDICSLSVLRHSTRDTRRPIDEEDDFVNVASSLCDLWQVWFADEFGSALGDPMQDGQFCGSLQSTVHPPCASRQH